MSFASPSFVWFLLAFLAGTILLRGRGRIRFFTLGSYLFYSAAYPPYVLLLLASTLVDFTVGKRLGAAQRPVTRRALLSVSLATNLGLLGVFKYAGFFAQSANRMLGAFGFELALPVPSLLLPVGISFYTFQTLSYTIDVYRRQLAPETSLWSFACYVSFFPQLVAGPIVRAADFLPQLNGYRPLREEATVRGIELVIVGLFKKLVIADNAARFVEIVFGDYARFGGAAVWLAALFFAAQIYCDFSGYSDVARGLGRILGFEIPVNFKWPYFSASIGEFWRRWHITLSTWLRDYLYFSMGGSRTTRMRRIGNLIVTWFLSGLWHGAAWTFVVWGLFHGGLIAFERLAGASRTLSRIAVRPLRVFLTFAAVCVGWVLFRADSISAATRMVARMAGFGSTPYLLGVEVFHTAPVVLLTLGALLHGLAHRWNYDIDQRSVLIPLSYPLRVTAIAVGLLVIVLFAGQQRDFIYFAF